MSKIDITLNENKILIERVRESIQSAFTDVVIDDAKKKVAEAAATLESSLEYFMKESLADCLADHIAEMAGRSINAILEGNEEEPRQYLSGADHQWTGRDRNHQVIHRELFEYGALALRKQIVDAYPELLKSERILDLESQLAAVVKENNKLEQRWTDQHRYELVPAERAETKEG